MEGIDRLFKVSIIIISILLLLILYGMSQNGRYFLKVEGSSLLVIDKRTGEIYGGSKGKWLKIDPISESAKKRIRLIPVGPEKEDKK